MSDIFTSIYQWTSELTVNDIGTIFGVLFGLLALSMSIWSKINDKPKLKIRDSWYQCKRMGLTPEIPAKALVLEMINNGSKPATLSSVIIQRSSNLEEIERINIRVTIPANGHDIGHILVTDDVYNGAAQDKYSIVLRDSSGGTWKSTDRVHTGESKNMTSRRLDT